MKGAKKIGEVYEQSKEAKKYFAVLNGYFIYLYKDKKDVEYESYYYLKNCEIQRNSEISSEKKPFEVIFTNQVNKLTFGF